MSRGAGSGTIQIGRELAGVPEHDGGGFDLFEGALGKGPRKDARHEECSGVMPIGLAFDVSPRDLV